MPHVAIRRLLIAVPFLLIVAGAAFSAAPKGKTIATKSEPQYGNSDAISQQEMQIYLYFLASDQLEGRNLPSRGFDTAALFVASHLAEWGLKPMGSASGTVGPLQPYFMPMELVAKTVVAGESKATIEAPGSRAGRRGNSDRETAESGPRKTELEYGKDWTMTAGRGAAPLDDLDVSGNLVFVGNGYTIAKTKADPYANLDVKGKILVVAGLPAELAAQRERAQQPGTTRPPNPLGEPCKDFMTPEQAAAKNGALAVITLVGYTDLSGATAAQTARFGSPLNGPTYRVPKLASTAACKSAPGVTAQLSMANAIFQGEKFSASKIFYDAGAGLKLDPFALGEGKKIHLKVTTKSETNHAENVVAMLEGGDPQLKDEYVVISAHLDHLGFGAPLANGHNINNGADDDGSGSTAVLAIAHAYAEGAAKGIRPRRSIIFLWAAGEEKGLWGSQYFTEYPPVDLKKVVADLNIDMIGRTKGPDFKDPDKTHMLVSPGEILLIGPHVSSDDLGKTIDNVNGSYQKLTLNHFYDVTKPDETHDNLGPQPRGQRIFYRSDHYNFARMGIPIAFFSDGLHPDYHRPTDTPDKIDYKQMQSVAKTVAAIAWQLGTQAGRPKINATLPEQLEKDMKMVKEQNWGEVTPVLAPLPGMPY